MLREKQEDDQVMVIGTRTRYHVGVMQILYQRFT